MEYLKHSFDSLLGSDARVLILGSIPGDRSILLEQYYGHPQNRFWRVLSTIFNCDVSVDYKEKKVFLFENKIALWDVAHRAVRKGSLDSAIRDEEPNDILKLLNDNPQIVCIAFNGKKAEQMYDKYFKRLPNIQYLSMPSTSPANATVTFDTLCQKWSLINK